MDDLKYGFLGLYNVTMQGYITHIWQNPLERTLENEA